MVTRAGDLSRIGFGPSSCWRLCPSLGTDPTTVSPATAPKPRRLPLTTGHAHGHGHRNGSSTPTLPLRPPFPLHHAPRNAPCPCPCPSRRGPVGPARPHPGHLLIFGAPRFLGGDQPPAVPDLTAANAAAPNAEAAPAEKRARARAQELHDTMGQSHESAPRCPIR